jgi:hypothetical protein
MILYRFFLQKTVFLISMAILVFPGLSTAQCDATLKPEDSEFGYKQRAANRCEGFYLSGIPEQSLDLVSATIGKISYDLNDKIICITSPYVEAPILIRASGIALGTLSFYRMDAKLELKEKELKWPVKDVLSPRGLPASGIGILGFKDSGGERLIVPVLVRRDGSSDKTDKSVILILRATVDVKEVRWRYSECINSITCKPGKWDEIHSKSFNKGWPFVIELPVKKTNMFYVEVAAQTRRTDQWIKKNFYIMNKKDD